MPRKVMAPITLPTTTAIMLEEDEEEEEGDSPSFDVGVP